MTGVQTCALPIYRSRLGAPPTGHTKAPALSQRQKRAEMAREEARRQVEIHERALARGSGVTSHLAAADDDHGVDEA